MSIDPLLRLAALHASDFEEARAILLDENAVAALSFDPVEDAVEALHELIESAIHEGGEEVVISTFTAELIAAALKNRKLPAGRPKLSRDQHIRRNAVVDFARRRSVELRASGMRPGKADETAAHEAAELGGRYGDTAAWTTILRHMRQRGKKPPV
jgi:hypothetical protein